MKLPTLRIRTKKLRASTARRSIAGPEMEYEEMAEPNMKLSRALLIVLVLHVVAVAGIIAFNTMKSRQGAFPAPADVTAAARSNAPQNPPKTETAEPVLTANELPAVRSTLKTPPAGEERKLETEKIPRALPVGADTGNFYTVAKGDNPVKIAKKLKVSESELLAANHIDDPRKLQIGQKLIVPTKAAKSKKPND